MKSTGIVCSVGVWSLLVAAGCGAYSSAPAGDDTEEIGTSAQAFTVDEICSRWNSDRQNLTEGTWNGSVSACQPGDMTPSARESALRLVNLYRFLVDMPAVGMDATWNQQAQACALLMLANKDKGLNHKPPSTWNCYTATAYTGASTSNLATLGAVGAVDLYMADSGNSTTMGHRRYILSNTLGTVGFGSASESGVKRSCMKVLPNTATNANYWTAWPPAGYAPMEAIGPSMNNVDKTGWTFQSEKIDLSNATASVTAWGNNYPVTVTHLQVYGSDQAIRFVPQGWTTGPGTTYHVTIEGGTVGGQAVTVQYDVSPIYCRP